MGLVLILACLVARFISMAKCLGDSQWMKKDRKNREPSMGSVSRQVSRAVFPDVHQLYTQSALDIFQVFLSLFALVYLLLESVISNACDFEWSMHPTLH